MTNIETAKPEIPKEINIKSLKQEYYTYCSVPAYLNNFLL